MNKENLNILISFLSFVLSIVAIALWFCKYEAVTWTLLDYVLVLISTLVGIFVATQIYHSFTLRESIKEDNEALVKRLDDKIKKAEEEISKTFDLQLENFYKIIESKSSQNLAIAASHTMRYRECLSNLIYSIAVLQGVDSRGQLDDTLITLESLTEFKDPIKVTQEEKARYIMILAKSGNERAIKLISYIQSLPLLPSDEEKEDSSNSSSNHY